MAEHGEFAGTKTVIAGETGRLELVSTTLPTGQPLVVCTPVGEATAKELISFCKILVSDPKFDVQVATLWDFRGFDLGASDAAECRREAQFLHRFPSRRGAKRACLVDTAVAFGHARMFQEVVSGYRLDDLDSFLVSYSLQECLEWLAN